MSTKITEKMVLESLKNIKDPDLGQDIVSLGFVQNIKISDQKVSFTLELTTPACPFKSKMQEQAKENIRQLLGSGGEVDITVTSRVRPSILPQSTFLPEVKNIVAIASGKGGVGKSTVSANLALSLAQSGAQVGLMDADIYGPSIPILLGIENPAIEKTEYKIFPVVRYGLKVISMGFFLPPQEAVIWRGPMLDKMIAQFLSDVEWGALDYLIIDLPPGTGDVQLSLCQKISLTGGVLVSTPQPVAVNIAQKAMTMFTKLHCPILGIIANMSYYVCPHCGKQEYIFGTGAIRKLSEESHIPFLGEIPLATDIRTQSDEGCPIVIAAPEGLHARAFTEIAEKLASQISICARMD
jgi:ATP-binding protein involved in chromosome partitioning